MIYLLTSTQFHGEVLLEFNDSGTLVKFDASGARLSQEQMDYLVNKLPKNQSEVKQLLGSSSTAKLTSVTNEITFDQFWQRYNEKIRSSRKRALARWNRMPKSEQIKAFRFISTYEMNLLPGTAKKYAETYLNAELWNN